MPFRLGDQTPLAAIGVVVLMVFAGIFHLRRPGERANLVVNVVLGLLAATIAWGRIDALRVAASGVGEVLGLPRNQAP
jgi:hypothetical protein